MSEAPDSTPTPWWSWLFSQDQIGSLVRLMLAAGGPLAGWLISIGFTRAQLDSFSTGLTTFLATVIPILISVILSHRRHTVAGNIASVEALPHVKEIVISSTAPVDSPSRMLADDTTHPKVVMKEPPPNPVAEIKKESLKP